MTLWLSVPAETLSQRNQQAKRSKLLSVLSAIRSLPELKSSWILPVVLINLIKSLLNKL